MWELALLQHCIGEHGIITAMVLVQQHTHSGTRGGDSSTLNYNALAVGKALQAE